MESHDVLIGIDARNRALRTFLQNIGFDVAAAVVVILYTAFASAESWGDFQWSLLLFTLVKTAVVTALSYLMRKVFDGGLPSTVTPPPLTGE